jgi:hypothetical protein
MNVSNCGAVENDASAKSRKDYRKDRVGYLLQVTHSVMFYIQIGRESFSSASQRWRQLGQTYFALVAARREPGAQE